MFSSSSFIDPETSRHSMMSRLSVWRCSDWALSGRIASSSRRPRRRRAARPRRRSEREVATRRSGRTTAPASTCATLATATAPSNDAGGGPTRPPADLEHDERGQGEHEEADPRLPERHREHDHRSRLASAGRHVGVGDDRPGGAERDERVPVRVGLELRVLVSPDRRRDGTLAGGVEGARRHRRRAVACRSSPANRRSVRLSSWCSARGVSSCATTCCSSSSRWRR